MIDLSKLAQIPYKHFLISKALCIAVEEMKKKADPNEEREVEMMQNLIDMEYPSFKAGCANDKQDAIDILTKNMELVDVNANGTKIYRSKYNEDIHRL